MTFRTGIIGGGGIGAAHAKAYQASPQTELVGVADVTAELAKTAADRWQVAWSGTVEQLLARPDVDIVSICTPPSSHAELAQAALAAGKHVLLEKPIAASLEAADRLVAAAEASDRTLMVAHSHRFWAANVRVKQLLDEGAIGRLLSINDEIFSELRAGAGPLPWRLQKAIAGGGVVLDNGVHALDRLRWWVGAPAVKVFANVRTVEDKIDVENNGEALIVFANGVSATLRVSTTAIPEAGRCRAEFLGTEGAIRMETWGKVELAQRNQGWREVPFSGPDAFLAEVEAFCAAIQSKQAPPVTARMGREALALVQAVYDSSRSGQVVVL
ncbi:MAG TPA: Gfo/Idh/MocA family oxidoreductase [Limnochordia bacterium]|nr:Gfo/Idh/MocA family oxidoreductase [Limnochordia bacterium]